MADNTQSSSWYRVAQLKPRLRDHIKIHRHKYRDRPWFILQDPTTGRSHRFNELTYYVITLMDGKRTLDEIWQATREKYGAHSPGQDALIQLLGKLHKADILQADVMPDTREITQRHEQTRKQRLKQYFLNPLSLRFSLINPDAWLNRTLPYVKFLWQRRVFNLWLVGMALAGIMAILNWPELVNAVRLHAFTTRNMALLIFIYPLIKLLHELGHAYAIKQHGGEVNEMGVIFLLFVPIPYVNANSATAFSEKQHRILVSAAGIMVETALAALALFIWLNIEPGLLRSVCLNVIMIGGISTLLFNGNPLMKYDSYYVLVDSIGIPNLAARSKKYLGSLIHHQLFSLPVDDTEQGDRGERSWLIVYGLASFVYRISLLLFILGLVIDKFSTAGIILAVWIIALQLILPSVRYFNRLADATRINHNSKRFYSVLGGIGFISLLAVFIVPMPQTSSTQGIIWLPREMQVRASTSGFVRQVLVRPNTRVKQGDSLIVTEDPLLASQVRVLESRVRELQVDQTARRYQHLESEALKQEIAQTRAELTLTRERLAGLTLKSPIDGTLILPNYTDLQGQYIKQGQIVGFVMQPNHLVTQVVIPESEIALYKEKSSRVEVRPVAEPDKIMQASFKRAFPEAISHLPSAALGIRGGGQILVDPDDPNGTRTMEKVFQVEFELPPTAAIHYLGSRVYVRISHGWQPLYQQWSRSIRQLFLRRFNV